MKESIRKFCYKNSLTKDLNMAKKLQKKKKKKKLKDPKVPNESLKLLFI